MTASTRKNRIAIAFLTAVGVVAIASFSAQAAIVTVNDSGSWINGTNTLSNQGFNLIPVPNGSEALGTDLSTLDSPLGNIGFSPNVNKRQVGNLQNGTGWVSWSNGYRGEVYFTKGELALDLKLPNLAAFDFYAEPDIFKRPFEISAVAQSGLTSDVLSQITDGNAGAKYFGFYSDDPLDPIQSIQITSEQGSNGFAIAQLRGAKASVPTPLLLPGFVGLGLAMWRRARSRSLK